ncbi:MAG: YifB family Mg chelatase-like AAA ATPase [Demequinaceae bacterium]|nr:YifB family Mg chelatase-like AAA ATPase [Demequinaceae bacterium]
MIGRTRSIALAGLDGHLIDVEAHLAASLPAFTIVGLPDASLSEARDRVRAAVSSTGLPWPARRITVNLSPASLPKSGSVTDVAIAVAVLAASGLVVAGEAARAVHLGELGLDGRVRPIRGVLPAVAAAVASGATRVVVPLANVDEARLVPGADAVGVGSLAELAALYGNDKVRPSTIRPITDSPRHKSESDILDLADVRGQEEARWALEVAAAGGHHLLMVGPPGSGKTMLAARLPGILPDLGPDEAVVATSVHSIAGTFDPGAGLLRRPPFEAPHHSASAAAIVGGGSHLARPGAISRAHGGVLFLDEAPEFPSVVLQTLRQPLEKGEVVLHRSAGAARYPARFQLVMAANPCPCGHYSGTGERCSCTPMARRRYFARLSGPLLDRVDLQVDVRPVRRGMDEAGESSAVVAPRVAAAREAARERYRGLGWGTNSAASATWLRDRTSRGSLSALFRALDRGALSARGVDRALRVAWTLADLGGREAPGPDEVAQAMVLRTRGMPGVAA